MQQGVGCEPQLLHYRILSCRFFQAQEGFLLARQGHFDSGARDAAVKRRVLVREEEKEISDRSSCFCEGGRDAPPGSINPVNQGCIDVFTKETSSYPLITLKYTKSDAVKIIKHFIYCWVAPLCEIF